MASGIWDLLEMEPSAVGTSLSVRYSYAYRKDLYKSSDVSLYV